MDDTPSRDRAVPADWLEAISEGEADLAAGRIVPSEQIMRGLREALARLEAPENAASPPKDAEPR